MNALDLSLLKEATPTTTTRPATGRRATLADVARELGHDLKDGMNCCPFHDDKTPSMSVKIGEGVFKCFGCGAKGGVVGYLRHALNTDDTGAKRWLRKHFPLKRPNTTTQPTKPVPEGHLDPRFKSPDLLLEIWNELDKTHKLDHKEKMALFLVRTTAELPNERDRCSAALRGDSSSGKDNAIQSVLRLFPAEESFFLTRGTQSALEEEAARVKCVAFSEINKNREAGANADITEFFKQLAEGGVNVIRRDQNTHEVVHLKTEQKTLFYGTTETDSDDELETRYVVIPIRGGEEKNRVVVDSVLDAAAQPGKPLEAENWVASSIRTLRHDVGVVIPYAPALKEAFDLSKERVKRDVKRLMSITKAVTWLHQHQRATVDYDGREHLLAEPDDLLVTIGLFEGFFNATYEGLDPRHNAILEAIEEHTGADTFVLSQKGYPEQYHGWAIREKVWKTTALNAETFTKRLKWLAGNRYVDRYYDKALDAKTALLRVGTGLGTKSVLRGPHPPAYLLDTYLKYPLGSTTREYTIYKGKEIVPLKPLFFISSPPLNRDLSCKIPGPSVPGKNSGGVSLGGEDNLKVTEESFDLGVVE